MQLRNGFSDVAQRVSERYLYYLSDESSNNDTNKTLLRFHDHQMLTSRKDNLGTELLSLPFRKEDLEAILEDLTA